MELPQDFKEFIELLIGQNVRFVMIGGWALNFHAQPRVTGDIDFLFDIDLGNQAAIRNVLTEFGFGSALPPADIPLLKPKKIVMLGREPMRIDLLTEIDGVTFSEVWNDRMIADFYGMRVPIISKALLIKNNEASGRPKDISDLQLLRV